MTFEELLEEMWCCLDIEKPLYKFEDAQISWNSMELIKNRKTVDSMCITLQLVVAIANYSIIQRIDLEL